MRNHVQLIWGTNFDSMENGGQKSFLLEPKHQCYVYQLEEGVSIAQSQKMKIITRIWVCPFWWMNFDSKENKGKNYFLSRLKYQNHVSK